MVLKYLFWSCLLLVAYSYVIYPLVVILACYVQRLLLGGRRNADAEPAEWPPVTVLITAYNEAACIEEKIANCLALDYPKDKLQIVIASDGSDDATNALAGACSDPRVQLLAYPQRRGKIATLNATIPLLEDEIIVLTDADAMCAPDAVRHLVRHFADERVGVVSGEVVMVAPDGGGSGEGLYWRYEVWLKRMESELGFQLGASGAIFAMRRSLFQPLPPNTINEDFVTPMKVLERGYRVRFEPDARATHPTAPCMRDEMRRKARIGAGGFQGLAMTAPMLNPLRGTPAVGYWSHKVLRWVAPFLMLGALIANVALATQPLYACFLAAQLAAYALGLQGLASRPLDHKLTRPVRYFFMMNLALLIGFFRFLAGTQRVTWERTQR